MTSKKKLEAVIQALTDSLDIVAHNSSETSYVLDLIGKYKQHYHEHTGRYYNPREIKDTFPTKEWIDEMVNRFKGVKQ